MTPQQLDAALDAHPTGFIYHTGYLALDRFDPLTHAHAPRQVLDDALALGRLANYLWGKAQRGEVALVQRAIGHGAWDYIAIKARGHVPDPRPA